LSALPLSAQGPVSATLGADSAAYRVSPSTGGLQALNRAQRLGTRFKPSGVLIDSGKTTVGLTMSAWGYAGSLHAVAAAAPTASRNRVAYKRGGLTEWYANGPLGLEQGFTVPRPRGRAAGPLALRVSIGGNARPVLAPNAQSLTFHHAGSASLRYAGLTATDARGHLLHSWLELHGRQLLIRVDVRGARFPVSVDPLVEQSKLTGGEESGAGEFGSAVALSGDGNTVLVGGPGDHGGIGAAWVFTRSGSSWTQQGGKLTATGESGNGQLGLAVALSANGNTALIGAPGDSPTTPGGFGEGAAFVFTRSGSTWSQQSKLVGTGEVGEAFMGNAVALSEDGNTALVGGEEDNAALGSAWAFTRSGSTWSQQGAKITGGEEVGNPVNFGVAVALSSDGNTALIGGNNDHGGIGAAWVFTRSGSTWSQQGAKMTGTGESSEGFGGLFGESVALSSDGNTALIGANNDHNGAGAAWVFTRSGSTWSQQGAKLTGGEEVGTTPFFGGAVALADEGNLGLIGGTEDAAGKGAAWEFTRSGSTWSQVGSKITPTDEVGTAFFGSVALSSEGTTAVIGGEGDAGSGAAWVYVSPSKAEEEAQKKAEEEAAAHKHAEDEAAARKHAEEEAAAKKRAEEEAARKHAEEEAAAKKHAEEETALAARVRSALTNQLAPSGKSAKLANLLKTGGYTFSFSAPAAGSVVISWYEVPKGAHLSSARPILVATGSANAAKVGAVKVKIKLTTKGKQLLRHVRSMKLTAKGSFTPTGKVAVVVLKTFTAKR
jgi:hypothetical protein